MASRYSSHARQLKGATPTIGAPTPYLAPSLCPQWRAATEPASVSSSGSLPRRGQSQRCASSSRGDAAPTGFVRTDQGLLLPGRPGRSPVAAGAVAAEAPSTSVAAPSTSSPLEAPYIYINGQRVHSLHPRGMEVIESMQDWAGTDLLRLLKPTERCWQPADLLPDPASPDFYDQVGLAQVP